MARYDRTVDHGTGPQTLYRGLAVKRVLNLLRRQLLQTVEFIRSNSELAQEAFRLLDPQVEFMVFNLKSAIASQVVIVPPPRQTSRS